MDFLFILFCKYCPNKGLGWERESEVFLDQMLGFLESSLPITPTIIPQELCYQNKTGWVRHRACCGPWVSWGCPGMPCRGRRSWGLLQHAHARDSVTRLTLIESKYAKSEQLQRKINCPKGTVVKFQVEWNVHLLVTKAFGFSWETHSDSHTPWYTGPN